MMRRAIGAASVNHNINYTYNLGGLLASLSTPPIKTVTYKYSKAGRATSQIDSGDGINFVTNATYASFGGLTGANYGSAPITIASEFARRAASVRGGL